jgi:RHS repeat-associated protein
VLEPAGRFYIAPDHLGAPHQITDAGGDAVWQWHPDPFGKGDPSGTFSYDLRFPGQFFDQATRLHYNYFRDYDPRLGRYIESDPIGLAGGINTYAYANGNPVTSTDVLGLCETKKDKSWWEKLVDLFNTPIPEPKQPSNIPTPGVNPYPPGAPGGPPAK